jgi:hypothetical protein
MQFPVFVGSNVEGNFDTADADVIHTDEMEEA